MCIAAIHEGKKLFTCDTCDEKFGWKDHLSRHIAGVHEGKKPFTCDICNATFA